ncbi:hypothetical protein FXO37_11330 [Capsicum annuum]|nr:hypothetical protein FXO37_11330 [Capsicum annuum]
MESGPSFSFGLTQIESTSNEINISRFVPGSFAYEDIGFHENRSKHRNDLTILKKLRDAATVKEKRTGMKYVINTVPHHPLRFGISFNCNFVTDVEYFVAISYIEFNMVEDGRYEQYPWGKIAFNKLMNSLRQDFFIEKQLYRLGGMPHVLNVKMYECCSEVDKEISFHIGNRIPSISNCFVVGTKPKFEKFMNGMFIKVVIEIDSSNKDVKKNETHYDDLGTLKEHPKHVSEKESETEFKNVAFQHTIDTTRADFSSQVVIDNIIAGMSTPIAAMVVNSDDLSQKVNLPDLSLQTGNVEVPNKLRESTKDSSTDASQESIDNIIAGISTPVVSIKMKSVSPTEISNNECQIHDTRFPSLLPEAELGKQDAIKTRAPRNWKRTTIFRSSFTTEFGSSCKGKESVTIDFRRKHLFDGYLISYDMPTGLIEEYCAWILHRLLKFHEKKKLKDKHYKANKLGIDFSSLDFVVAKPDSKNWFYTMSQTNTYWNDEDSMLSSQHREPSNEIKKLSVMLPTYLTYSGFLENTKQTVWDCGVFVATYTEFLSNQMQIPSSNLHTEYLRKRYASLLWNYGVKKDNKIYSSDHDDPPRPRPFYVPLTDECNILAIE